MRNGVRVDASSPRSLFIFSWWLCWWLSGSSQDSMPAPIRATVKLHGLLCPCRDERNVDANLWLNIQMSLTTHLILLPTQPCPAGKQSELHPTFSPTVSLWIAALMWPLLINSHGWPLDYSKQKEYLSLPPEINKILAERKGSSPSLSEHEELDFWPLGWSISPSESVK